MESVLSRYRNLIILVGVLFLQVLGLAMQVKRGNDTQDTRLIRIWAVGAMSPLERSLVWVRNSTGVLWHNYFYLRGVRAENRQLREQIEQMRLEQVRLSEDAAQAHRLQSLLAFKEQFVSKTVAAQVIGSSGSDMSRVVYIDKGENAGIRRDMAVITAQGIVGKVLMVYPTVSQVLLINDQSSGVGAILEKSRLQGVLRGAPNGEVMLERVMSDEQVAAGDVVLTSGGDQIFPKGLPVGAVSKVGNGKDLFLTIKIKPASNLSKLEEVLVLLEKQERQAIAEDKRVRAADILAQRLPSVPDKLPAASATGAIPGSSAQSAAAASVVTPGSKPKITNPITPANAPPAKTVSPVVVPGATSTSAQQPISKVPDSSAAAKPKISVAGGNATAPEVPPADVAQEKPATPAPAQSNSQPAADNNDPH
jgi:rod shape-determining protein MreC